MNYYAPPLLLGLYGGSLLPLGSPNPAEPGCHTSTPDLRISVDKTPFLKGEEIPTDVHVA